MIRRGKKDGWLHLPIAALDSWSKLNGVQFEHVAVQRLSGAEEKGSALAAITHISNADRPYITVPRDLVLSQEAVRLHAKADIHLRDLLEAAGDLCHVGKL